MNVSAGGNSVDHLGSPSTTTIGFDHDLDQCNCQTIGVSFNGLDYLSFPSSASQWEALVWMPEDSALLFGRWCLKFKAFPLPRGHQVLFYLEGLEADLPRLQFHVYIDSRRFYEGYCGVRQGKG